MYRKIMLGVLAGAAITAAGTSAFAADGKTGTAVSSVEDFRQHCTTAAGQALMGGAATTASYEIATKAVPKMPTFGPYSRPNHCFVKAVLNKRVGVDGKPYEMRVEMRLPEKWNGRFFYAGGAGVDGLIYSSDGVYGADFRDRTALQDGFAVVGTDSGHQREDGPKNGDFLFAADPQARDEYGDQQIPLVYSAAMRIMTRVYGKMPEHSYFWGSSNGGRQAMIAAQRHPDLFDGIIAINPGFRLAQAAVEGTVYRAQLAERIAPRKADGSLDFEHTLPDTAIETARKRLLDECDGLDGLKDGLVFKSLQCKVDPMKWACARGVATDCLTPAQAAYLRDFFAGSRSPDGKPLYASMAADPRIILNVPEVLYWIFWGEASHVYTTPPTISADMNSYLFKSDLMTEYKKLSATNDLFKRSGIELTNADSPNMDAFKRHGGKIVIFTGAADVAFPATDAAAYMDTVFQRYGREATDGFARLYIVPGAGHNASLPPLNEGDPFQALYQWVEQDRAPDAVLIRGDASSPWPGRERPICTYPKVAIYKGSGSSEKADSFQCE